MYGDTPPLPDSPSWGDAQLNHRDNFTLYLTINRGGGGIWVEPQGCKTKKRLV
jgi:hypothetical protein